MQNVEQVDGAESATVNGDLQHLPVARRTPIRSTASPAYPMLYRSVRGAGPVVRRVQAVRNRIVLLGAARPLNCHEIMVVPSSPVR